MAAICMERNYKCIRQLEDIYPLKVVIYCALSEKIEFALRARFARLLITLHMDKDPLEKLNIPIMTRVWDDIEKETIILPQSHNIQEELLSLKPAFEEIVRDTQGNCRVYQSDFNTFMLEVLKIIEVMIGLGFYETEEEMIQII